MGIKFRCPNGHKLNVKSFLAGKKGICPHCGTKVIIPDEVEQDDADDAIGENAAAVGGVALAVGAPAKSLADTVAFQPMVVRSTTPSLGEVAIATAPSVRSASVVTAAAPAIPMGTAIAPVAVPVQPATIQPAPIQPVSIPAAQPISGIPIGIVPTAVAMPAMSPVPAMPALVADPIAEAPNAVWYVRPPSGGQFGPARGDIMRKWLGEGRVSADSLVWRDGWTDWKSATIVFPQLAPASAVAAPSSEIVIAAPTLAGAKTSTTRNIRVKRKSNSFAVAMVVILGLISVILVGLLAYVIGGGFGEA